MSHPPAFPFTPGVTPPAEQSTPAYWLLFRGDDLVVCGADGEFALVQASSPDVLGLSPVRTQYLGCLQDGDRRTHCHSGEIREDTQLPDGFSAQGLRSLFGVLGGELVGLAGRAVQVVRWDRDHQFCGRCATPTKTLDHERAKRCPQCGLTAYPRLSPAIIIAVTRRFEDGERILLARNHRFPEGRYSVVAGFVEPGETLEECCRREVMEEVGIHIQNIRYFHSQPWPFPNSLMVGFTAEYAGGEFELEEEEIADAQWFGPENLPHLPPKISIARRLIDAYLARNGVDPRRVQDW